MASYKLSDLPPHVVAKIRPSDLAELEGGMMLKETSPAPPHDPVLSGLFDQHSLVELVGMSKTRKSYLSMQLALCLASGRDFLNFKVARPFRVLLVDMQMSENDINRRYWYMGKALGIAGSYIKDRLKVRRLAGVENPLAEIEVAASGFDVVICDPLFCLCDGGEAIDDLRKPLQVLRRLANERSAVIYVHDDTLDRESGSRITGRSVDARIAVTPAEGDAKYSVVLSYMCQGYVTPAKKVWRFNGSCFAGTGLPAIQEGGNKKNTPTATPTAKRREPNKTELRYKHEVIDRNQHVSSCIYEGLTFRLSNGHRYTPDWIVACGDQLIAVEVKGSYRFHSHGRARLAFDQARIEWPTIRFIWATWTGTEWKTES